MLEAGAAAREARGELKAGVRHRRLERWQRQEMEACVSLGCRGRTLWGL